MYSKSLQRRKLLFDLECIEIDFWGSISKARESMQFFLGIRTLACRCSVSVIQVERDKKMFRDRESIKQKGIKKMKLEVCNDWPVQVY